MRVMAEEINYFLLLMLMQQFGIVQPKRVARVQVISYDSIRVSRETQAYCAVTHANVTQNNKKITDCCMELAQCSVKLRNVATTTVATTVAMNAQRLLQEDHRLLL